MLVCKNTLKERVNVLNYSKEQLKRMSKNTELICPECDERLIYCHGKIKTPYFRHMMNSDCSLELLGETEEHRQGKLLLYRLAEKLFPKSYIDLEYKLLETNQRADVIAIHPDGNRTVFEMQCSNIPPDVWEQRCLLYKSIDIEHIWVAGAKLVSFIEYDEENKLNQYKLRNLAREFLTLDENLVFLDVKTNKFHIIRKSLLARKFSDNAYIDSRLSEVILEDIFILNSLLTTNRIERRIFKQREAEEQKRVNEEKALKKREEELKKQQEEFKRRQLEYKNFSRKYLSFVDIANVQTSRDKMMTSKEQWLFNKLVVKHGYNNNTFPGIFYSLVNNINLIKTPPQLWQLWLYDSFIYSLQEANYNKIHVPKIFKRFKSMIDKGIFRVEFSKDRENMHYSFAIWDYIERLSEIGILTRLGYKDRNNYRINIFEVPVLPSKKENDWLCKGLSLLETGRDLEMAEFVELNNEDKNDSITVRESYKSVLQSLYNRDKNLNFNRKLNGADGITPSISPENQRMLVEEIIRLYKSDNKMQLNEKGYETAQFLRKNIEDFHSLGKTNLKVLNNLKKEVEQRLGLVLK